MMLAVTVLNRRRSLHLPKAIKRRFVLKHSTQVAQKDHPLYRYAFCE
ncbi:MAG TPA: hypothetical protein IGS53_29865 [Leptolyngbyaceae cyanobacterium M33_DOE_097]|nr:hypothetical protein [Leptolyngbyaceae cyanobacterium M33_DOE_097]